MPTDGTPVQEVILLRLKHAKNKNIQKISLVFWGINCYPSYLPLQYFIRAVTVRRFFSLLLHDTVLILFLQRIHNNTGSNRLTLFVAQEDSA